jgi:hypothetical protein
MQEPKSPAQIKEDIENEEADDDYKPRSRIPPGRENAFGAIPGIVFTFIEPKLCFECDTFWSRGYMCLLFLYGIFSVRLE